MRANVIKQISFLALIASLFSCGSQEKMNLETSNFQYDMQPAGVGSSGTYLVKVWTYAQNTEEAITQAPKNAIHGIIYKGFEGVDRLKGQSALVSGTLSPEKQGVINQLLSENGGYRKYVNMVGEGAIAPGDRIKVDRNKYKIGVTVSVNVNELRKFLEAEGVIKSLNDNF